MPPHSVPPAVGRPDVSHPTLWALAVLFFGVGDVVTTSVGLGIGGLFELGPVTSVFVERYRVRGDGRVEGPHLRWLLSLLASRPAALPRRGALGLALLGVSVTGWNLYLLALVVPS
jgi:hypothetical protein